MPEPTTQLDLAVVMTTHNSIRTIERTVRSVIDVAARVLTVDSGSTDGTIECCRDLGVDVIERPWAGHVKQKQFAIDQVAGQAWVLLLDSDEAPEPDLRDDITRVVKEDDPAFDAWSMNRKVWFLDGWLEHAFQPEWRTRLLRPSKTRVAGRVPHDYIEVDGRTGKLTGTLRHDSWSDLGDMCHRHVNYGRISAENGARGGRLGNVLVSPSAAFLKQYILKRGVLDGRRGLLAAGGAALGALSKHLFIAETRARGDADQP